MEEKTHKDKRRYIRFENTGAAAKAESLGKFKLPDNIVDSVAMGLSPEGISLRSTAPLEPGSVAEVDVAVPFHPKPLILKGEVRWCKPVKTAEGKEIFESGIKLQVGATDEGRYLLYICDKMMERIRALEEELSALRQVQHKGPS
jgi:hypothetical protein